MAHKKNINQLKKAYNYCNDIAKSHYENFPVISLLLPENLRNPIAAIYSFARIADDYADNPKLKPTEKLNALNIIQEQLMDIKKGTINTDTNYKNHEGLNKNILLALEDTIHRYELPMLPFFDLLKAFNQDVIKNRYYDFAEVLTYCSYSANPIGRLLLHITKQDSNENLEYSDYICTGLQLINFMQDIYLDITELDRCYIPENELDKFHVSIDDLKYKRNVKNVEELTKYQLDRITSIYSKGMALGSQLKGIFGFEVKLIIACGNQILRALYKRKKYYKRPTLTIYKKIQIMVLSLFSSSFFSEEPIVMVDK